MLWVAGPGHHILKAECNRERDSVGHISRRRESRRFQRSSRFDRNRLRRQRLDHRGHRSRHNSQYQRMVHGTEFVAGFNAAGSALTYSALFPIGTVAQAVAVDPMGFAHVAGSNGFVSVIALGAPPVTVFGLQNAFGGYKTQRISPAEVISIYGPGIGPAAAVTAAPSNGFYPTTLSGVQVKINGMSMPLLYVSANQINAVAPMELTPASSATIKVTKGATSSAGHPVWIVGAAPQASSAV
jgi:hypothetical protein